MNKRAVSPIIGLVIVIALVLALSQVLMLLTSKEVKKIEKPPFSATVQGRLLEEYEEGQGWNTQIVELLHIAGDPIPVSQIKIRVEIYRDSDLKAQEVFWGFPCNPSEITYEGDDIVSRSNRDAKYFGELRKRSDGIWSAGEKIGFRIKRSAFTLQKGDIVSIRVIHIPSNSIIIQQQLKVS